MDATLEMIWTRYAVNRHKISRAQLQTCLEEQGKWKGRGQDKSVADLILEHGFLDLETLERMRNLEGLIPGYQMKRLLGNGGLGVVYKARQLSLEGYAGPSPISHTVLVVVGDLHRGVVLAIQYAQTLSPSAKAVYVEMDP